MKKAKSNTDPKHLRVLILEDNRADAELVEHELHRTGIIFTSRLVEGKKEFSKALAEFQPQVILSDFKLPLFDGLAALEIARVRAPDTPFIFVSGSIGEEKAIKTLAQGASDYIFKDNLQRLGPAVKRTVEVARLKLEKKNTEQELRLLAEAADRFVHFNELDEVYNYLAQTIYTISGADYLRLSLYDEKLQALQPKKGIGFEPFRETIQRRFNIDLMQLVFFLKDMRSDDFSDFVSRKLLQARDGLYGLANCKIPRASCLLIEKLLAVSSMHIMGFSWENQLFGGLTIFFKKGNQLKNASQVEALINLAAVAIKRLLAEKSLRNSEERFRHISTTTSDISYSCLPDTEGNLSLAWMSGATERITGYTIEELLAMKCWGKLVLAEDLPEFEKSVTGLTAGNSGSCELRLRYKNGDIVWVQSFAECTQNPEQAEQTLLYGGLVDISERKLAEFQREAALKALRESEYQYKSLIDNIPDIIFTIDLKGKITFISRRIKEILGYENADTINMNIFDFIPEEDRQKAMENLQKGMKGEKIKHFQVPMIAKSGEKLFFECSFSRVYKDGAVVGAQGTAVDISERKRADEQIHATLKEKEVLLQEIHHRVKNNLQIISGLLTLQADQAIGKPLSEIFQESQDRIRSIALIHEKLYRSRNLAEIAFDEYVRTLTENLFISHGVVAGRITVTYEMEPILFTVEKAIPLGLIVNELLTNSLKHAFPDGRQGGIRITLQECRGTASCAPDEETDVQHAKGKAPGTGMAPGRGTARRAPTDGENIPTYELVIADNGVGLPAGFKADTKKSLGMHLVSMLAQQIQAELEVKTGPGTEFRFIFSGLPANAAGKEKDHAS